MFRKFLHPISTRPLHPVFSSLSGKDLGCCVFEESMAGRVSAIGAQTTKWALRPEGLKPRSSLALHYGPDSPILRRIYQMMPDCLGISHLEMQTQCCEPSNTTEDRRSCLNAGNQISQKKRSIPKSHQKEQIWFQLSSFCSSKTERNLHPGTLGLFSFFRLGASTGIQNSVSLSSHALSSEREIL